MLQTVPPYSPPVKNEYHPPCVCALVVVPFLSIMPLQLYDLPFDMLEMIGKSYDDLAPRDATARQERERKVGFIEITAMRHRRGG